MRLPLALGAALLSTVASAQERPVVPSHVGDPALLDFRVSKETCVAPGITCAEMRVQGQGREIVRLGVGGCIIGPFVVYDENGKALLSVAKGASVPTNCASGLR